MNNPIRKMLRQHFNLGCRISLFLNVTLLVLMVFAYTSHQVDMHEFYRMGVLTFILSLIYPFTKSQQMRKIMSPSLQSYLLHTGISKQEQYKSVSHYILNSLIVCTCVSAAWVVLTSPNVFRDMALGSGVLIFLYITELLDIYGDNLKTKTGLFICAVVLSLGKPFVFLDQTQPLVSRIVSFMYAGFVIYLGFQIINTWIHLKKKMIARDLV